MSGIPLSRLVEMLLQIETKAEMQEFLEGILTQQEIIEISQRLEIIRLLKQGMPQHEIAKKLGVGVATVTRGAKELKRGRFKDFS
jgi:TrpR family trp operon transcriptional repressor